MTLQVIKNWADKVFSPKLNEWWIGRLLDETSRSLSDEAFRQQGLTCRRNRSTELSTSYVDMLPRHEETFGTSVSLLAARLLSRIFGTKIPESSYHWHFVDDYSG
jgi:hypothetical protein